MSSIKTAGAVIVGNEVLSGKVQDANGPHLIERLREHGVRLDRICVIRDDKSVIAGEVAMMTAAFDWVFTSGGIGSTHDDVTVEAVAEALGRPVVMNDELEAAIISIYRRRRKIPEGVEAEIPDRVRHMARVPEGAELLGTEALLFPLIRVENIFVLPGVPQYFQSKLAHLEPLLRHRPFHLREVFLTAGEEMFAEDLAQVDAAHPSVEIGSYPRFDDAPYRAKVCFESHDAAQTDAAKAQFLARIEPSWIVNPAP